THSDGHTAEIEGDLQPHLASAQFHNDTVRILKTRAGGAAANGSTGSHGRVGANNVFSPSQIMGAAHQIGTGGTKRPNTEPTNTQGVAPPPKSQRAGAPTDADDETGFGNPKSDSAGFGLRRRRHCKQHECRKHNPGTALYHARDCNHYSLPTVTTSGQW